MNLTLESQMDAFLAPDIKGRILGPKLMNLPKIDANITAVAVSIATGIVDLAAYRDSHLA